MRGCVAPCHLLFLFLSHVPAFVRFFRFSPFGDRCALARAFPTFWKYWRHRLNPHVKLSPHPHTNQKKHTHTHTKPISPERHPLKTTDAFQFHGLSSNAPGGALKRERSILSTTTASLGAFQKARSGVSLTFS